MSMYLFASHMLSYDDWKQFVPLMLVSPLSLEAFGDHKAQNGYQSDL